VSRSQLASCGSRDKIYICLYDVLQEIRPFAKRSYGVEVMQGAGLGAVRALKDSRERLPECVPGANLLRICHSEVESLSKVKSIA
jgi:hypothetical protein